MHTNTAVHSGLHKWIYEFEFTITAAGAIVPNSDGTTTTDPQVSVTRTGAGTYQVVIPGQFERVQKREVQYHAAAASAVQAQITAISIGGGTSAATGEKTTLVTIITGNSNAVPAAADQASGTIACSLVFQKTKA